MTQKSVWGPAIWYLFHTLSYKIKDECFVSIKTELVQFIYRICANLPCPECAAHAIEYWKSQSKRVINNKGDLFRMLVDFHNTVNARHKKPAVSYEAAAKIYECARTRMVVEYFFQVYGTRETNIKLMINNFQKSIIITDFLAWINKNSLCFDP